MWNGTFDIILLILIICIHKNYSHLKTIILGLFSQFINSDLFRPDSLIKKLQKIPVFHGTGKDSLMQPCNGTERSSIDVVVVATKRRNALAMGSHPTLTCSFLCRLSSPLFEFSQSSHNAVIATLLFYAVWKLKIQHENLAISRINQLFIALMLTKVM